MEFGYKVQVPLLQIPTPFSARNNSSDLVYSVFVENAIIDFIKQGCVVEVSRSLLSFTLSCVYSEIWRKAPYYDLRHVYRFLYKKNLSCEDKRCQNNFASN